MAIAPAAASRSALISAGTLAAAQLLARRGRYRAAEEALGLLPKDALSSPPTLDLQARIAAQSGRLERAAALWRRALELEPQSAQLRAALARVEALALRSPRRLPVLGIRVLTSLLVLVAVGLLAARGASRLASLEARLAVERAELRAGQDALRESVVAALASAAPSAPPELAPALPITAVAGVSIRAAGRGWSLTFERGLFSHGTQLAPSGRRVLDELAAWLEPGATDLAIEVLGHTDSLRPDPASGFPDNPALALARAVAVSEHLRRSAAFPPHRLTARAGAAAGENREARGRSPGARTASLWITAAPSELDRARPPA